MLVYVIRAVINNVTNSDDTPCMCMNTAVYGRRFRGTCRMYLVSVRTKQAAQAHWNNRNRQFFTCQTGRRKGASGSYTGVNRNVSPHSSQLSFPLWRSHSSRQSSCVCLRETKTGGQGVETKGGSCSEGHPKMLHMHLQIQCRYEYILGSSV